MRFPQLGQIMEVGLFMEEVVSFQGSGKPVCGYHDCLASTVVLKLKPTL
jgi:hypothetical protein